MSTTKKRVSILAIAMAAILAFSMIGMTKTAFAATANASGQIKVQNSETGRTYNAYQVFKTDASKSGTSVTHSSPEWGEGVNSNALMTALVQARDATGANAGPLSLVKKPDDNPLAGLTVSSEPSLWLEAFKKITGDSPTANSKTRTAEIKELARIIQANVSSTNAIALTQSGGAYATSTPVRANDGTISGGIQTGWYLVDDASAQAADNSFVSDNILLSVPSVTFTDDGQGNFTLDENSVAKAAPKGDKPKSGKETQEDSLTSVTLHNTGDGGSGNSYGTTSDYQIGDYVPFRIWGTLPFDFEDYTTYEYTFTDNLPTGLALDPSSVEVYAVSTNAGLPVYSEISRLKNGETGTKAVQLSAEATTGWTMKIDNAAATTSTAAKDGSATTKLEISFANLRNIQDNGLKALTQVSHPEEGIDKLAYDSAIVVLYKAKITSHATVGSPLINTADLTYSSDKHDTGKKEDTPDKTTYTWTYEVDSTKYADATNKLPNAEFVMLEMIREKDPNNANATLTKYYVLQFDSNGKVSGRVDVTSAYTNASSTFFAKGDAIATAGGASAILKSNSDGNFNAVGLNATATGTNAAPEKYILIETKAPDGYNRLTSPIEIQLTATPNNTDPTQTPSLVLSHTAAPQGSVEVLTGTSSAPSTNGKVSEKIINKPGNELPETGGMGTFIFTIVGISLMVVAAVAFVVRRRNQQ